MASKTYLRISGHVAALTMHGINSAVMFANMHDDVIMRDPEIKTMVSMQATYLTVWNIGFQMAYFSLALACEILTLTGRDHLLPKFVKKFRDFFFSSVVFPGTLLVFLLFWPFFLYDRSIIFPEFIDKIFSLRSNLVMHLGIVPVVLWEIAFQPRDLPKSQKPYYLVLATYSIVYNSYIHYVYYQRGLWPYPLLGYVYGTIYNVILHIYISIMLYISYSMQWPLSQYFVGGKSKSKKFRKD